MESKSEMFYKACERQPNIGPGEGTGFGDESLIFHCGSDPRDRLQTRKRSRASRAFVLIYTLVPGLYVFLSRTTL